MKRKEIISILVVTLTMILMLASLTGCGQNPIGGNNGNVGGSENNTRSPGGVLYLMVNPEIAITYDENGMVTKVEGRNDDGKKVLESYTKFTGKECRQVVTELVNAIGEAGFFVEEIEGENKQIVIEIEKGSQLPSDTFIDEIVSDVRTCVNNNNWKSPVEVEGESDYGITDYDDTDYGSNNDGVTDYDDTDYGPNNDGVTDYDDTDYGPNNDGDTDYDD